ncbi:MAG: hypothetical protein J5507_02140 [Clostridia bacterium]|nr:hypothetical protein [Clostridia bacterium]
MKRLYRVSIDTLITSIIPIISWFLLGKILRNDLINVFTVTYPLQCITGIINAIFGVGANISEYKDNNKNSADNGIFYGIIFSLFIYGIVVINIDKYISFMNLDVSIYKVFTTYSAIQIMLNTILSLITTKLYYENKNKESNKISLIFNIINFIVLTLMAIITKNEILTVATTLVLLSLLLLVIIVKNIKNIDFKLNIKNCIKYDSSSLCMSFMFFLIYFFGFSNSFNYGEKYVLAITFVTLITDMQWDIKGAIDTVAKIDIAKKDFNYIEHRKNACKLVAILISSIFVIGIITYPLYKPDLKITGIFVFLHIVNFIIEPFYTIKEDWLQLEVSASKTTLNKFIAFLIRNIVCFMPTPFCTILGQMASCSYEFIYSNINYKTHKKQMKNSNIAI